MGAIIGSVSFVAFGSYIATLLLDRMPISQILWLRFAGYVLCMAPVTLVFHWNETMRPYRLDHQITRGVVAVAAAYFLILGLKGMNLGEAVSVFYIYPAIACIGSLVFLGEPMSSWRWAALAMGFIGVLLILRPDAAGLNGWGIFIIISAALVAAKMVLHRHYAGRASPLVAAFWERAVGVALLTFALPFSWTSISGGDFYLIVLLIIAGIGAQILMVLAIFHAPLSRLAPFTYWEILFALALQVGLQGIVPEPLALIGVATIVVAGLVISKAELTRSA